MQDDLEFIEDGGDNWADAAAVYYGPKSGSKSASDEKGIGATVVGSGFIDCASAVLQEGARVSAMVDAFLLFQDEISQGSGDGVLCRKLARSDAEELRHPVNISVGCLGGEENTAVVARHAIDLGHGLVGQASDDGVHLPFLNRELRHNRAERYVLVVVDLSHFPKEFQVPTDFHEAIIPRPHVVGNTPSICDSSGMCDCFPEWFTDGVRFVSQYDRLDARGCVWKRIEISARD